MAKYSEGIKNKIAELLSTGEYGILEICAAVNIDNTTYYNWKKNKPDFSEAIKEAERKQLDNIKVAAKKSLWKLINGYEYEEVTQEAKKGADGKIKETHIKKTTKVVPPQTTAVIFALKNTDKENFGEEIEKAQPVKIVFEEIAKK